MASMLRQNGILSMKLLKNYTLLCRNATWNRSLYTQGCSLQADVGTVQEAHTRIAVLSDPCYDLVDLTFENAEEAFKSKTNSELLRALFVFNLTSIKPIVTHNKKVMTLAQRVLGKTLFRHFMKASFYGQFVAGEDEELIKPTVDRNQMFGVKSILDYSVEKDISQDEAKKKEMEHVSNDYSEKASSVVSAAQPDDLQHSGPQIQYRAHEDFGDRREGVTSAKTYFYEDEKNCDENMKHFIKGIEAVAGATNAQGFAAIKLTALGRPQFLMQLSEVLFRIRNFYTVLAAQSGHEQLSFKHFKNYLKFMKIGEEERARWYSILDAERTGTISLLDWDNLMDVNVSLAKLLRVPNMKTGEMEPLVTALTDEEETQMKNMMKRINSLIKLAVEKDVRVMIDAEHSYFQMAINRMTMEMMRKYNKEKAYVFNTYQCYLKETHATLSNDLALSKNEDFYFGCKLVRGAYMEQERERAAQVGYEDPINPTYEATTEMYQKCMNLVFDQIHSRPKGRILAMVASHNEDTVRWTVNAMQANNIAVSDRLICFGQLLGMCDQISFSLGQAGYSVYKYVPYGPVEEVLPYLSRRATENQGILAKVKKEKRLLWTELKRRLKSGQFSYTPTPPVTATSP